MNSPHIHIPFERMPEYIDLVIQNRINLEIFFKGDVLDRTTFEEVKGLKDRLSYGPSISIHAPFMDLSPSALDPKIRAVTMDRFLHTLELASLLGAKIVVFHSGYEKWKYALDANLWLEKGLETWRPLNLKAQDLGIRIAIENIFEDEPSNLRLLMEEMASDNFGICFDTGHFNIFSTTPLQVWMDSLRSYIIELHIHDNDKTFDQHRPVGEGNFDFPVFFNLLGRRDVVITLENHSPEAVLRSLKAIGKYGFA